MPEITTKKSILIEREDIETAVLFWLHKKKRLDETDLQGAYFEWDYQTIDLQLPEEAEELTE